MLINNLDFMRGIEKLKKQHRKTVVNVSLFFPKVQNQLNENILLGKKNWPPDKKQMDT